VRRHESARGVHVHRRHRESGARREALTKVAHHALLIDRVTRDRLGERIVV